MSTFSASSLAPPCNGPFRVPTPLVIAECRSDSVDAVTRHRPHAVLDVGTGSGILALAALRMGDHPAGDIGYLVDELAPAVRAVGIDDPDAAEKAMRAHVGRTVRRLRTLDTVADAVAAGRVAVVGAVYDLDTGVVTFLSYALTNAEFVAWGWRVAFMLSIVLLAVGLFIRLRVLETPEFAQAQARNEVARVPMWEVLRDYMSPARYRQVEAIQFPTPLIEISSSDIRRRVAEGRTIRFMLPRSVERYIETAGLYRTRDEEPTGST